MLVGSQAPSIHEESKGAIPVYTGILFYGVYVCQFWKPANLSWYSSVDHGTLGGQTVGKEDVMTTFIAPFKQWTDW